MNPHHPAHQAAYPHHPSLSTSPHHPGAGAGGGGSGPGSGAGGGSGAGAGGGPNGAGGGNGAHHGYGPGPGNNAPGTTTTPDLPSPHSPTGNNHGQNTDPTNPVPYGALQVAQAMGSNGHHHPASAMMPDHHHHHQHHPGHPHAHLPPGHPAYSAVNHNNNCTLKQESGPSGPNGIQTCAGCGGQIVERWLLFAMDRYWHNGCLKCTYCGTALAEIGHSCYYRSGMILCKSDYRRMFGSSGACSSCGLTIPASELVMRAGGSVFHLKCFTCTKCGGALVSGDRYYLLSGSPVCETDWHKIVKSTSVAAAAAAAAAGNGGAPVRKGKVGRPRRSRE